VFILTFGVNKCYDNIVSCRPEPFVTLEGELREGSLSILFLRFFSYAEFILERSEGRSFRMTNFESLSYGVFYAN